MRSTPPRIRGDHHQKRTPQRGPLGKSFSTPENFINGKSIERCCLQVSNEFKCHKMIASRIITRIIGVVGTLSN